MIRNSLLLFWLLFFSTQVFSQLNEKHLSRLGKNKKQAENVLEHTVIIKIKSAMAKNADKIFSQKKSFGHPGLQVHSVRKLFPDASTSSEGIKKNLNRIPDLSLLYVLEYAAPYKIEEACQLLMKSGLIEYAEPYYLDEVLVIPNDPAAQPGGNQDFYLKRYQAYEAWDITTGDSTMVIGIVDTGVRYTHEDLQTNVKYNLIEANGADGVDDDGDGYIDNFRGWDFGNSDNNPDASGHGHGTVVAGSSSSTTNNGKGIAGTGYNCSYLPLKASADANGGTISYGYQAIYYAANRGVPVLNLSWGSASSYSQTAQDIINYAVLGKNVVIIAAAGNSGKEQEFYPASYKHVISVSSCDTIYSPSAGRLVDKKPNYATYDYSVDLCAQGISVYSTNNEGSYHKGTGTSFAAPQVAGAAGLVRTKHPKWHAVQVMEQLRVTGDIVDTFPETELYKEKYGRRLNMYKALVDTITPSVRMYESHFRSKHGDYAFAGDTVKISMDFLNYLYPTANCKVSLSSSSPLVDLIDSVTYIGSIGTLDSVNNYADPFVLYIHPDTTPDLVLNFRIQFDDGDYYDYQHFKYLINPSYINIDTNQVALTITSKGKLGYTNLGLVAGSGFSHLDADLLYEAGLMISLNDSTVSDCVRADPAGTEDDDFSPVSYVKFIENGMGDEQVFNRFNDSKAVRPIGLQIDQQSFAYYTSPQDKYIIVEYIIKNNSGKELTGLNSGIYADWDIMDAGKNRTGWIDSVKTGYAFSTQASGLYAGVALLTPYPASYYALDHHLAGGTNINPNDGFPSSEKFATLSNGVYRTVAGASGEGADVSHVVGTSLGNLANGESIKIAFAIIGGSNLTEIAESASNAREKYKQLNTAPVPVLVDLKFCEGDTVDVTIGSATSSNMNFYHDYPGTLSYSGSAYLIPGMFSSDSVYVTNLDSLFESKASRVSVLFKNEALANFIMDPSTLDLATDNSVTFSSSGSNETSLLWDFGDNSTGTFSIENHIYSAVGDYIISLEATGSDACISQKIDTLSVINSVTTGSAEEADRFFSIYPVPVKGSLTLSLANTSSAGLITVSDLTGRDLLTQKLQTGSLNVILDVSSLVQGVYFIRINSEGKSYMKKFIKD